MAKVPHAGEQQAHARSLAEFDRLFVPPRATRLHDRGDPGVNQDLWPVGEGEEAVAGGDASPRTLSGLLDSEAATRKPVHLPGASAIQRGTTICKSPDRNGIASEGPANTHESRTRRQHLTTRPWARRKGPRLGIRPHRVDLLRQRPARQRSNHYSIAPMRSPIQGAAPRAGHLLHVQQRVVDTQRARLIQRRDRLARHPIEQR